MFSPGLCSPFLTWGTWSQDPFRRLAAASEGTRGGRTSPTQTRASGRLNSRGLCLDLRLEHAHFLVHLHILQFALQNPQLPLGLLRPRWGEDAGRHHLLRVPSQAASPTGTAHATAAAAVAAAAKILPQIWGQWSQGWCPGGPPPFALCRTLTITVNGSITVLGIATSASSCCCSCLCACTRESCWRPA